MTLRHFMSAKIGGRQQQETGTKTYKPESAMKYY